MPNPPRRLALVWMASGLIAVTSMARSEDRGTPPEFERDPTGWTDLLAGAGPELKGWTRLPVKPGGKLDAGMQWSLDPSTGVLTCRGDGGHDWLRSDEERGDFIYHVEWRFTPVTTGKRGYNSGIYVRNSADARVWHQAQVGGGPAAFLFGDTLVGGKLERIDLSTQQADRPVRPAGEWNTFEVTCRGKAVSLWVNGRIVNEWHDCEVPRGYLGLEAEGYRIEFRNVKVKPL